MADQTPRHSSPTDPQPTQLPEGLSRAALIRAGADCEGVPTAVPAGSERQVAFEQELRHAVARVMAEPVAAPPELRRQILAGFETERASTQETEPVAEPLRLGEHQQRQTARRSALLSILPRFGALAAVLALSATLVYVGVQQFAAPADPESTLSVSAVSTQLQFVQREHTRCSDIGTGAFTSKVVATDIDEARSFAESQLGCGGARLAEAISRMKKAGYSFIGVGPCAVPGGGKSIHALFAPIGTGTGLDPVSVFLLEKPGKACDDAKPGVCYSCPSATKKGKPAMLWRDDALMVFVHSDSIESINSLRAAYFAPETIRSL